MHDAPPNLQHVLPDLAAATADLARLRHSLETVILGQPGLIGGLLTALLIGGHVLIEGPPGVAKTLAANALARTLGMGMKRVQGSPDLLPSDLVGTQIFHQPTGQFHTYQGPVFTNILLVDEINRTPPKVQSALLEAMQEQQVTLAQQTHPLDDPFFVLATQNPFDHEGTYPLPDAQLDRFALKLTIGYPAPETELAVMRGEHRSVDTLTPQLDAARLKALRQTTTRIHLSDTLARSIVALVGLTREGPTGDVGFYLESGVSPRASLYWAAAARAHALLAGSAYVRPSDVTAVAAPVLRHRLALSFEAAAESMTADALIARLLELRPPA
ncbi:MAG: MoxR family ATPase [Candidatus Sericytochromatia bacterium]|nr:MoxR family ATPase [Candidatus Sericytochromatia bacterium]